MLTTLTHLPSGADGPRMRIVRPLVLALLVFALPAAGAEASSLTITPPSQPPNYWQGFTLHMSGVADQNAKLYVMITMGTDQKTCPALWSDTVGLGQQRVSSAQIAAGAYSVDVPFYSVQGYPKDNGSEPGPHTV